MKLLFLSALVTVACATTVLQPIRQQKAEIESYPYQLSLLAYGNHVCGGSIISNKFVVTAASCTDRRQASDLSIRAGSSTLGCGGQVVNVAAIRQHPQYFSWTHDYDISVLELASTLSFGSGVQKVNLPSLNQNTPPGFQGVSTGWGILFAEVLSNPYLNLQEMVVEVISYQSCKTTYGGLTERMICSTVKDGTYCTGDIGGPMTVNNQLIGIVSYGRCTTAPQVYTSVARVRDFITQQTGI